MAGESEREEYYLGAHTSFIGRSDTVLVQLRGWFKPAVAVAIACTSNGDSARRQVADHEKRLEGRHNLQEGDRLSVGGLVLEFGWKDGLANESAA